MCIDGRRNTALKAMHVRTPTETVRSVRRDKNCESICARNVGQESKSTPIQHWLKNQTRVWSFNSQYMNNARARDISRAIAADTKLSYVGIQGTQQKYAKGELRVEQWSTDDHDIWELKQRTKSEKSLTLRGLP